MKPRACIAILISLVFGLSCRHGQEHRTAPEPQAPNFRSGDLPEDVPASATGIFPQSHWVSQGRFHYSIPIVVPPGRAGMEPSLSLSYSSARGHGMAGYVGWSIGGLSSITRCSSVLGLEGSIDGVDYDDVGFDPDVFCADGRKLVPLTGREDTRLPSDLLIPAGLNVEGAYGFEDASSNLRFVAFANGAGKIKSWAEIGAGRHYRLYGETDDSRLWANRATEPLVSVTLGWLLSGEQQRGNRISYDYVEDPTNCDPILAPQHCDLATSTGLQQAARYIDSVTYTEWTGPNPSEYGGAAALRRVKFNWTATQGGNHRDGWVSGLRMKYTQQLESVEVYGEGNQLARKYWLVGNGLLTDKSERTQRDVLAQVTVCDPLGTCQAPTTFTYDGTDHEDEVRFSSDYSFPLQTPGWLTPAGLVTADVSGDGFQDVLYVRDPVDPYEDNQTFLATSTGELSSTLFSSTQQVDFVNISGARVFDANGDLYPNLLRVDAEWTGSRWLDPNLVLLDRTLATVGTTTLTPPEDMMVIPSPQHVDLDGDGIAEMIAFARTWQYPLAPVRMNIYEWDGTDWVPGFGGFPEWDPGVELEYAGGFVRDFDGDGRQDFMFNGYEPQFPQMLRVDDSGALQITNVDTGIGLPCCFFLDINGDRLPDMLEVDGYPSYDARVRINTGHGYASGEGFTDGLTFTDFRDAGAYAIRVADFNEDHRDDVLLMRWNEEPELWISNGLFLTRPPDVGFDVPFDPASIPTANPEGYFELPQLVASWRHNGVKVLDANDDGIVELVVLGQEPDDGPWIYRVLTQAQSEQGVFADMMRSATDGFGAKVEIDYDNLARLTDTSCVPDLGPPARKCVQRGALVKELRRSQPTAAPRRTQYLYRGARSDVRGRGFLGFEEIVATDPDNHLETITRYDQTAFEVAPGRFAYPYAGAPEELEQRVLDGPGGSALLTRTQTRTSSVVSVPDDRYRVLPLTLTETATIQPGAHQRTTTTTYADHDGFGFPETITTTVAGGVTHEAVMQYEHDPGEALLGQITLVTETFSEPGSAYPPVVREVAMDYDPEGLLEESITEPGSTDPDVFERLVMTYWPGGLLKRSEAQNIDASLTRGVELVWNGSGSAIATSTDDLGHSSTTVSHPLFGGPWSTTDANGLSTTVQYDTLGRVHQVTAPDGTTVTRSHLYLSAAEPYAVLEQHSSGAWSQTAYDVLGRPVGTSRPLYDGTIATTGTSYDHRGRVAQRTLPADGSPLPPPAFVYAYGALGELESVTGPGNGLQTSSYVGFDEHSTVDEVGRVTRTIFDANGRAVTTERRDASNVLLQSVSYVYDAAGRQRIVEQAATNPGTLSLTYDVRNRLVSRIQTNEGQRDLHWNALSDLEQIVESSGGTTETTTQTLDPLGRVTDVHFTPAAGPTEWDHFVYGSVYGTYGLLLGAHRDDDGDGLFEVEDHFAHDGLGRLETHQRVIDGETFAIDYDYDPQGRVEQITYPEIDGARASIHYGYYGPTGELETVHDHQANELWRLLDRGVLSETVRKGADLTTITEVDPFTRRLSSIRTHRIATGEDVYHRSYGYFPDGRIASTLETEGGVAEGYTYDGLGRLAEWTRSPWSGGAVRREYAYDDVNHPGLLWQVTDYDAADAVVGQTTYTFGGTAPAQAIASRSVITDPMAPPEVTDYVYDDFGRETYRGAPGTTASLEAYNRFDLPTQVVTSSATLQLAYSATGQRVRKADDQGTATVYVGELYERRDEPTQQTHKLHVQGGGYLGYLSYDAGSYTMHFAETDHRGSVDAVVTGATVERSFYTPFGASVDAAGTPVTSEPGQVDTFAGHDLDVELGLRDMKARLYDPHKRQFLATDPVFLGFDVYAYTHDDPINRIDPDGRCDELAQSCHPDYYKNPYVHGGSMGGDVGASVAPEAPDQALDLPFNSSGKFAYPASRNESRHPTVRTPAMPSATPVPTVSVGDPGGGVVEGEIESSAFDYTPDPTGEGAYDDYLDTWAADQRWAEAVAFLPSATARAWTTWYGGTAHPFTEEELAIINAPPRPAAIGRPGPSNAAIAAMVRAFQAAYPTWVVGTASTGGGVVWGTSARRYLPVMNEFARTVGTRFMQLARNPGLVSTHNLLSPAIRDRIVGGQARALEIGRWFGVAFEKFVYKGLPQPLYTHSARPFQPVIDFQRFYRGTNFGLELTTWQQLFPHLAERPYCQAACGIAVYPGMPTSWPFF